MAAETKIGAMIAPSLDAMGYRLVIIRMLEGSRRTLQIMAERKDDVYMTVEDCAEISRVISALLDVEDPISGAYALEVSSPGIDRPLVTEEDFDRYSGRQAKVETHDAFEGRKRFKGLLLGMKDKKIIIEADSQTYAVPFSEMKSAKLVLTDELMREHLNGNKNDKQSKDQAL